MHAQITENITGLGKAHKLLAQQSYENKISYVSNPISTILHVSYSVVLYIRLLHNTIMLKVKVSINNSNIARYHLVHKKCVSQQ